MFKSLSKSVATLPFLFAIAACSTAIPEEGQDEQGSDVVDSAMFLTKDGGEVNITLEESGAVNLSVVEPAQSKQIMADYANRKADLADLYVGFTGNSDVPEDVQRMNRAYQAALAANDEAKAATEAEEGEMSDAIDAKGQADVLTEATSGALALTKVSLTREQFIQDHCRDLNSKYYYDRCWPNCTGTWSHEGYHYSMHTQAYSYRGTVTHKLQRDPPFGGWETQSWNTVPQGYLSTLDRTAKGLNDKMRGGVWDASGDGYHLAMWGVD